MKTRCLILAMILTMTLTVATPLAMADEGMWLFNAFPKDRVQAHYGFVPTQVWLDHVRMSSVRFNNGGSGSFVSADGLAFTNHHVGADCIQKLSKEGTDFMKTGFYAKTQAEEAKCPDLELNVLMAIDDVSAKVKAASTASMSAAEAGQAQRGAMSAIEKECAASTGMRCDLVTLYSGEVFHLYQYKKYTDVRLVFAPEFQAAFFGGDPDNFTYPRYDLDTSFFRIYENDKPVHLTHYLNWSKTGVKQGDLIFVSGHPGNTDRLKTVAQMQFLRDVDYPSRLANYKRRIALFQKFSAESAENARIAQEDIFGYQNSQKAITGYFEGLRDEAAMSQKETAEKEQEKQYMAKHPQGPNPWEEIATAMKADREIYKPVLYTDRLRGFNSELAQYARWIVRAADEKAKANGERLREFRDSALPSLEQRLFSTAPIYKTFEYVTLADSLAQMQEALGANDSAVKAALGGKSPDEVAKAAIDGTKLDDVAARKQLYEGGKSAVDASTDPMIVLLRNVEPIARSYRKRYDDEVDAVERRDGATIAKARFEQSGFTQPPDATFTLRLSYGAVKGYDENGKKIPYFTDMAGAFQHAEEHGNKPPYDLAPSWPKMKSKVNLFTPLNFVSTPDIIGGNSGSPTINKEGEVVGIIFDGNIQSLVWNFFFDERQGRAVSVDARGIIEALRNIYGANTLADELTGPVKASEKKTKPYAKRGPRKSRNTVTESAK
ncbi:MAG TPA: S46 family peptidase [Terriglobales bacterium]|nr:S46 family peptidase [Terriglobales bacterium]